MENIENQLKNDYIIEVMAEAHHLAIARAQKFTQVCMAKQLGVSLRKIQLFESLRCFDYYLVFGYKKLLSE